MFLAWDMVIGFVRYVRMKFLLIVNTWQMDLFRALTAARWNTLIQKLQNGLIILQAKMKTIDSAMNIL